MGTRSESDCFDRDQKHVIHWCNKFNQLWERSDFLFALLRSSDDFYRQPIQLRLPLLFYLGHLPCFAWRQFRYLPNVGNTIDEVYDELFQRGVDPDVQTGIVHHQHSSQFVLDENDADDYWRSFSVESVMKYKSRVRLEILDVLKHQQMDYNNVQTLNILNVALEHEMMHQETLMYLFAQLPLDALRCETINETNLSLRKVNLPLTENQWVFLPGGQISLGKEYSTAAEKFSFGWDNEFPAERSYVSSFDIQSHPIRIGDYLEFVLDHGYSNNQCWDEQIFQWLEQSNISHPISWTYEGNSYSINFIFQRHVPIECVLDHPVIVSRVEAKAYCRWLSQRTGDEIDLPTEAEWIDALWDSSNCIGESLKDPQTNIDFRHFHTASIESRGEPTVQWQGSAFEWTSSLFRPFDGYRGSLPTYPGYSSDFFDGKHFVLLGGSFVTDQTLIRRTFRNWYQEDYRYVCATFRCVKRNQHTDDPLTSTDREKILQTLSNPRHRTIPSEYLYDACGSKIYERITQLEEYYLYHQELKLLEERALDMKRVILENSPSDLSQIHFIELGCGDGSKVEAWLTPWMESSDRCSAFYHPVDVSQQAIDSLTQRLSETIDEQIIQPICSTFEELHSKFHPDLLGVRVMMLMGSTIGNFSSYDSQKIKFARNSPVMKLFQLIRSNLKSGDWFICGFDLCKDPELMVKAYNDSQGITAAFNYNVLSRLNRELKLNFQISNYQHYALFNPRYRQMESWLISRKQQTIEDANGFLMHFEPYEAIQTEVSSKYTHEDVELLMAKNSFRVVQYVQTEDEHFPYAIYLTQAI